MGKLLTTEDWIGPQGIGDAGRIDRELQHIPSIGVKAPIGSGELISCGSMKKAHLLKHQSSR